MLFRAYLTDRYLKLKHDPNSSDHYIQGQIDLIVELLKFFDDEKKG